MGLKHIVLAEHVVSFAGGDFSVRGLSLNDVMAVFGRHRETVTAFFKRAENDAKDSDKKVAESLLDSGEVVKALVSQAPNIAAEIIALAAGESVELTFSETGEPQIPVGLAIARSLPFPAQVEALEAIFRLTFTTEGGLKKVVEAIVRMADSAKNSVKTLKE